MKPGRHWYEKQCAGCGKAFLVGCKPDTAEYQRRKYCTRSCRFNYDSPYGQKSAPLEVRFWAKVDKSAAHNGCWVWTGARRGKGYGDIVGDAGRRIAAHQLSYKWAHGSIPDGLFVLHKCDNKLCVNPDHLFVGTHQDNMDDMVEKVRLGIRAYSTRQKRKAA